MECLDAINFFKAFRHPVVSWTDIPPALLEADLTFGGRPFDRDGSAARRGESGIGESNALGVDALDPVSGCCMTGKRSFGVKATGLAPATAGLTRGGFTETLTEGVGGAISTTGVTGIWSRTEGAFSSTARNSISANLRIHHRTSWSTSGALWRVLTEILTRKVSRTMQLT